MMHSTQFLVHQSVGSMTLSHITIDLPGRVGSRSSVLQSTQSRIPQPLSRDKTDARRGPIHNTFLPGKATATDEREQAFSLRHQIPNAERAWSDHMVAQMHVMLCNNNSPQKLQVLVRCLTEILLQGIEHWPYFGSLTGHVCLTPGSIVD